MGTCKQYMLLSCVPKRRDLFFDTRSTWPSSTAEAQHSASHEEKAVWLTELIYCPIKEKKGVAHRANLFTYSTQSKNPLEGSTAGQNPL
eukprot:1356178-Amorphochlora_amoeboformis.AAC.1